MANSLGTKELLISYCVLRVLRVIAISDRSGAREKTTNIIVAGDQNSERLCNSCKKVRMYMGVRKLESPKPGARNC